MTHYATLRDIIAPINDMLVAAGWEGTSEELELLVREQHAGRYEDTDIDAFYEVVMGAIEAGHYRACFWVSDDGQAEVVLTTPDQSGLPEDDLEAAAREEAARVGVRLDIGSLDVGLWVPEA